MSSDFISNYFSGAKSRSKQRRSLNYNANQNALMRKKRSDVREIGELPSVAHPRRVRQCSKDLKRWLKTYMPRTFSRPWSDDHVRVIQRIETALFDGGLFAFAMPRGSGKTSIIIGAILFAALYGLRRYIMPIATSDEAAQKLMEAVLSELTHNERIKEDFPQVCWPIECLEGIFLRAGGQTYQGRRTNMQIKTKRLVLANIPGSPSAGIRIEPKGITSKAIRGSHYIAENGEILRPDFVILDDPQDDESARSPSQCDKREQIINSAVLGLAGPGRKISGFMPCTVIQKDDLADRMLDSERNPEWQGIKTKMLYSFPTALETLWAEYRLVREDGLRHEDGGAAGNKFYEEHREEMDAGAEVAWLSRRNPDEISALQHAMNLYFRDRSSFFSEYQNEPEEARASLYNLTAEIVRSRVNGFPRFHVPDQATFLAMMFDVNQIGLNYTVAAFDNNFTGWIVDYGKYPEKTPLWEAGKNSQGTESQAISNGIMSLVRLIVKGREYVHRGRRRLPVILADANYMTQTVHQAVAAASRLYPVQIIADRGRGVRQYRPAKKEQIIGQPGNNFHLERGEYGRQVVHCSDYWRMAAQKAFLLDVGVPGSLSIFGENPEDHEAFAKEIVAERLLEYLPGATRDFYDWYRVPGEANDKLDSTVGCFVCAAFQGARLTGGEKSWRPRRRKRRETRKPKVSIVN